MNIDINNIIDLYTNKDLSLREIGRVYNCEHGKIKRVLVKNNISVYSKRIAKRKVLVTCKNCNKKFTRYIGILNKATFCSKLCYNVYRDNHKVHNNRQLTNRLWASLRKSILDKFPTCVLCGSSNNLHIHHIFPRKEHEDLCYIVNNLITLCRKCHCSIKGNENKYVNYFSGLVSKSGELLETPNVKTRTISSQAIEGKGSMEGSETTRVSPNNNLLHECPTRKGRYSPSL